MINASFFIENKEIIGLMIIYSISMWLAVYILDYISDYFKQKRNKKVVRKIRIAKEIREIQEQNWKYEFQRNFEMYVVNFEI